MDMTGTFVAAGIGAFTGAGVGLFGSGLSDGLIAGSLSGGAVGFAFSLLPRSPDEARVPLESFSPAGALAGLVAGVVTSAGWVATLITMSIGWTVGVIVPAGIMVIFLPRRQQSTQDIPRERGIPTDEAKKPLVSLEQPTRTEKKATVTEISVDVEPERSAARQNFSRDHGKPAYKVKKQREAKQSPRLPETVAPTVFTVDVVREFPASKVLKYDSADYPSELTMHMVTQPVSNVKNEIVARSEVTYKVHASENSLSPSMALRLVSVTKSGDADDNLKTQLSIEEIRLLTSQITNGQRGEPGNSLKPKTSSLKFTFSDSTGEIQIFHIDRLLFKQMPHGWLSWELPSEVTTYWRLRF